MKPKIIIRNNNRSHWKFCNNFFLLSSKESDNFSMIDCEDFYDRFDALANQYEKAPFEATGV